MEMVLSWFHRYQIKAWPLLNSKNNEPIVAPHIALTFLQHSSRSRSVILGTACWWCCQGSLQPGFLSVRYPWKTSRARPVALLVPLSLLRMLRQWCSAFHPPPCLSQGLFCPAQGWVQTFQDWLHWDRLCVCVHRLLLIWAAQMLIHRKGAASSTPGWALCREQCPPGKSGPLERHLCIKPQLRGWGTETWVWGLICFKSVQEGSFCDSGQINFTFFFYPILLTSSFSSIKSKCRKLLAVLMLCQGFQTASVVTKSHCKNWAKALLEARD